MSNENTAADREINGYTFAAWLSETGRSTPESEYDLYAAWAAGEDPAEYSI